MPPLPKPVTVLRTAAGTPACVSQIGKLRDAGLRVVAADCDPLSAGFAFADAAACVPRVGCPDYVDRLLELCQREKVDWLLPALDEELLLLAAARARFDAVGTRVLLSQMRALEVCTDKLATYGFFRELGIPTPPTIDLHDLEDHGGANYPMVIKPRRGRGSRDVYVVNCYSEAAALRGTLTDCVAQTFVAGEEFTVDILADFDSDPIAICPRRRIATDSGISVKSRVERDSAIESHVAAITRELGLIGLANVQCFRTPCGEIFFTEINARVAGTSILSAVAGAPLFSGLAALLRGELQTRNHVLREDLVMLRYWSEVYVTPDQIDGWNQ